MEIRQIKVSSYNCAGFKSNYEYISDDLFKKCNILLLQET